jgi:hypothetical protein
MTPRLWFVGITDGCGEVVWHDVVFWEKILDSETWTQSKTQILILFLGSHYISDFFWSQGGRCLKLTSPNRPAPDRSLIGSGSESMSWVCSTQRSSPHYPQKKKDFIDFLKCFIYTPIFNQYHILKCHNFDLNTVQETYWTIRLTGSHPFSDFFWSQGGRCSKLTSPNRPAPDRSLSSGSVSILGVFSIHFCLLPRSSVRRTYRIMLCSRLAIS